MSSLNVQTIPNYKPLGYFYLGEYQKRFTNYNNEAIWTKEQRVSFIESIIFDADGAINTGCTTVQLAGHKFPKIVLQKPINANSQVCDISQVYNVLEGFQRIKTLHEFFSGRLPIPRTLANTNIFKNLTPYCGYEGTQWIGTHPTLPNGLGMRIRLIQYPVEIIKILDLPYILDQP